MKSYELVSKTVRGENSDRTPVYGWLEANLKDEIAEVFGSVENFEDKYEFDMAHIFGCPPPFKMDVIENLKKQGIEITPEVLLDIPLNDVNSMEKYDGIISSLKHHRIDREKFCYMQTPGIFECLNEPFGIENHLMYMALYPNELKDVYRRQAEWNIAFSENVIELKIDDIHISDDWGAQNSMMFSYDMWKELIYPSHKYMAESIKKKGVFLSLHSDGNIAAALDGIVDIGYDIVHPWQETAGMTYDTYLKRYSDKFAILGGVCIQSTLGFGDYKNLESEITRVFNTLKGERWICCTTHFVQEHCSIEELVFAFDLIKTLR